MPDKNGDEIIEELLEENPDLKIMILSVELDPKLIRKTIGLGALGFVSKNVHVGELVVAMEKVLAGKQYLCSDTTMALINNKKHKGAVCHLGFELTEREKDVLDLLAEGFTSNEVAEKLHLSVRTVETHRRNMLNKYGARNVTHLLGILYAQKE